MLSIRLLALAVLSLAATHAEVAQALVPLTDVVAVAAGGATTAAR